MENQKKMTVERLREFDDAWGLKDVDALMTFMADDCEYHASVGPNPGQSYRGLNEVRQGFEDMLKQESDAVSAPGEIFVIGNRGVTEWAYDIVDKDGTHTRIRGCDIWKFEGDKIKVKDAYRKGFPD